MSENVKKVAHEDQVHRSRMHVCSSRGGLGCLILLSINLLYSTTGVFSKMASRQEPGGIRYCFCVAGAVGVLGLYAMLWQQIIARFPISFAYLFRCSGLVFALLFAAFLWDEPITGNNLVGAVIMMIGITVYVKS